jgi:hypothetical protein
MTQTLDQLVERQICEQATGCHGAGDFRRWAAQQGYQFCEVFDWTSSAGDWSFIVSKDGETWYPMFQENNYPRGGFTRNISDVPIDLQGPAEAVLEYVAELCELGIPVGV